ncbi:MAG: flippase [Verrucomicrobiota bacterium]
MESLRLVIAKAKKHQGFRRYLGNTGWLFGGRMLQLVLGLFVSIAVARYLGPSDFGLFNFVLSIVALLAVLGNLGLQALAKRQFVEEPDCRDDILGTCLVLSVSAGLLVYACLLAVASFVTSSNLDFALFSLLGASSLLFGPFKLIEVWFQSQVRSDLAVTATGISLIVFSLVKLGAIYFGASVLEFAYISLVSAISFSCLLIYFYKKHFGSVLRWRFKHTIASDFLKQCWPLILSGLAIAVYMKIDQIMLGTLLGQEAVGYYSVAVKISSVWYFIPAILATSLFPAIMNARKRSRKLYVGRLQQYFDLNAGLSYLICVPLSFAAPLIVDLLFGDEFSDSGPILAVQAWSSLFVFLGVARGEYLVAEKLFKFSFCCTVLGAIINIALNYALIPVHGGLGAAIATLVSYAVSAFLSSAFLRNNDNIFRRQVTSLFAPCLLFKMQKLKINETDK